MEEKELFNVYSFRLMQYLVKKGFMFIATKQMEENPTKTIFRFVDSPELREAVDKYTEACREFFNNGGLKND